MNQKVLVLQVMVLYWNLNDLCTHLIEIVVDQYLSLDKFTSMLSVLPGYACVVAEGIYKDIDKYLKVKN